MTKRNFLEIMSFPDEWFLWDMYPDELASIQMAEYEKGHERSSEHTRFGAFLWWISKLDSPQQYELLKKLSSLDPDQGMAKHAQTRLNEQWDKVADRSRNR